MADAGHHLQALNNAWENCTNCQLGVRRSLTNSPSLPGYGVLGGIMFIGEAPSRNDERSGQVFTDDSMQLLATILNKLQFTDAYFTNLVICRSCEEMVDPDTGLPRIGRSFGSKPGSVMYKDRLPLPKEMEQCLPRLYEEIYYVDPVLIVALGGPVAEALTRKHVTITRQRGRTVECVIPGKTLRPVLTDKKQVWGRKLHGSYHMPTEPNEVAYDVLLSMHPGYVQRKGADSGRNAPVHQFVEDIRLAVKLYERYLGEALGLELTAQSNADLSTVEESHGEDPS